MTAQDSLSLHQPLLRPIFIVSMLLLTVKNKQTKALRLQTSEFVWVRFTRRRKLSCCTSQLVFRLRLSHMCRKLPNPAQASCISQLLKEEEAVWVKEITTGKGSHSSRKLRGTPSLESSCVRKIWSDSTKTNSPTWLDDCLTHQLAVSKASIM